MANSGNIFKALCDGLVKGLKDSDVNHDMWFVLTHARCDHANSLLEKTNDLNTRDRCIAMYIESINVILTQPHALALLPNIKTLFQIFNNNLKNYREYDAVKQWIDHNQPIIEAIINELPDPPGSSSVLNRGAVGCLIGFCAIPLCNSLPVPIVLMPVLMALIGGGCTGLYNSYQLQQFETACQTTRPLPILQVIDYRRKFISDPLRQRSGTDSDPNRATCNGSFFVV